MTPVDDDLSLTVERRFDWRRTARSLVLPGAVLVLIVGGLWYWQNRSDSSSDSPYGPVALASAKNPTSKDPAPEQGRAAPDFLLERADGGTLRLSDLQGKPVLLNFWASWCPPCKEEMPEIVDEYAGHKDDGLVVVAVNLQEPDSKIDQFAQEYGMDFPVVIDRTGDVGEAWRIGGAFEGLPSSYFIDSTGVVRGVFNRPLTRESIEGALADIMPEGDS